MTTKTPVLPERPLRTLASSEESAELRRHYLQNLVHELATPLTPLLGYLKLFNRGSLGELTALQSRCLESMSHAAGRLHRVIEDLSYLLQMESGTYRLEAEPFGLHWLVKRALDETAQSAEEEQIEVLCELAADDIELVGDEVRLLVALQHLIWNGLKFNTAGGKLMVRAGTCDRPDGVAARIEVFDTGIGIESDELGRVFEPFYQCDHAATRRFGGAGLGLPLVHWVIGVHGGTVRLESPPSVQPDGHFFRGLRAILELPLGDGK